jgi:hypothetical protein
LIAVDSNVAAETPSVFISHTTHDQRDRDLAHCIANVLTERGARVWIAPESIAIGDEWQPHLVAAVLEECTHFVVILSAASIQADWVMKEIGLARERYSDGRPLKVLSIRAGTLHDFPEADFLEQFQEVPYESDPNAQARLVGAAVGVGQHAPAPIRLYLAAVREYCSRLSYLTLQDLRAFSPSERYVPLRIVPESTSKADRMAEAGKQGDVAAMMSSEPGQILLLGEPGSGKSTLLRMLAERCWDAPETIGLSRRRLPLSVPLRRLTGVQGSMGERLGAALASELTLADPLPDRFIEEWPQHTGTPWLILLDAFDEVPASEQAKLAAWIEGTRQFLGGHRVIVSMRSSSAHLNAWQGFAHYRLLPFTREQTRMFAQNWFGDGATAFMSELDRLRVDSASSTVLLLTIAARVYLKKRQLPEARVQLYRQCVDLCLEEAGIRGLDQELGGQLAGPASLQAARLSHLALRMTENLGVRTPERLGEFVAEYLVEEEGLPKGLARPWGKHFVDVIAQRSGILVRRGDACSMVHSTFEEYLTACAIASACAPGSPQGEEYASRSDRFGWFEIVLFLFGCGKTLAMTFRELWIVCSIPAVRR